MTLVAVFPGLNANQVDVCFSCFTVNPALKTQLDDLLREEVEFVNQYDQWKQQYHDWQEQNKSMCCLFVSLLFY